MAESPIAVRRALTAFSGVRRGDANRKSPVNPPVPLSQRAREFPHSRQDTPRATLWVLLGPPRATLFELLTERVKKATFSLAENEKRLDWVNRPGVLVFLLLFPGWKTQAPASNPLRNVAPRDSERGAVFLRKMKGLDSRAGFWLVELLTRFPQFVALCVNGRCQSFRVAGKLAAG